MSDRPNVVYIHSHDTGRAVQPYGFDVPTPGIQRLAEGGVVFRQGFCAGPTCSPSRASLVSSLHAHQHGCMGLAHRGWQMNDFSRHIQHWLGRAGYRTALSGIQHIVHHDRTDAIGYQDVLIPPGVGGSPELAAATYIFQQGQRRGEQPFFLSVGFGETHREFPRPGRHEIDPRWVKPPAPFPDTDPTREDWAGYIAHARTLDRKMSVVFNALEESGQLENTLVICTTDHGLPLPRMKCTLHDEGIGVMLILRGPGGFTGGRPCDAIVSQLDLFPTICDVCDVPAPDWIEGVSLRPLVDGRAEAIHDEIFASVNYHACYEPQRCVRTARYKYTRRFGDRDKPVLPNVDDSPTKRLFLDQGWFPEDREGLYDLLHDPHEMRNLLHDPAHAETLNDLRGRLRDWQQRTGDPILDGPIPAPPEAVFNEIDSSSPYGPLATTSEHPQC